MGFKKAGSKKVKKVKKAPGKKGRKDGWDLEGGQFIEDTKTQVSSDDLKREKRAPRKTQERDEYIRRGRAKIEERKKKYQLEKKMSKKISFGDVLSDDDKEVIEEVEYQQKVVKRSRSCEKSSKSIMERLQGYVKKDLIRTDEAREEMNVLNDDDEEMVEDEINDDDEEIEEEEYEIDEEEYNDLNGEDDKESETDDINNEDIIEEVEDANSDSDVEEEKVSKENKQDDFDWFFNPIEDQSSTQLVKKNNTEINNIHNEVEKLSEFDNFQIYGKLHPTLKNHGRSPIECLKGVHGLHKMWRDRDQQEISSNLSKQILPYLGCYTDIMMEGRDHNNDGDMLSAVLLHSCNHVVRARSKILKHNQKAKKRSTELAMVAAAANAEDGKKKKKAAREAFKKDADSQANEKFVDQGFCRPRVLILCPFRGTAMKIIEGIKEILGENTSMSNKEKFEEEFGAPDSDSEDDSDEEEEGDPKTAAGKSKSKSKKRKEGREKPDDWNALFKDSNMDDDFKLGIQINPGQGKGTGSARGAYLRMYCDFFQSDIIIASPLGLRLLIEKNNKPQGKGKEQLNSDFLSSLELIFLHQSDVLYMQNWEHVEYIMSRTNKLAENDHGTDFSRVRPYFLEGKGVEHRQLIVTTHFNEPTIQSAFRTHGQSMAGIN
jgi:U3 small nucleolar RNA-associated protein 25